MLSSQPGRKCEFEEYAVMRKDSRFEFDTSKRHNDRLGIDCATFSQTILELHVRGAEQGAEQSES